MPCSHCNCEKRSIPRNQTRRKTVYQVKLYAAPFSNVNKLSDKKARGARHGLKQKRSVHSISLDVHAGIYQALREAKTVKERNWRKKHLVEGHVISNGSQELKPTPKPQPEQNGKSTVSFSIILSLNPSSKPYLATKMGNEGGETSGATFWGLKPKRLGSF